jgi:hypothetical protein
MTGDLILASLGHAWVALRDREINACVIGGLALAHWGHARFTKEVDLLALLDAQIGDDLARALAVEGFVSRRTPAVIRVGQHSFMQFMYTLKGRFDEVPVDLLIADSDFLRSALQRAVPFRFAEIEGRVVSCEDLVLLKLQADRLIDRMDVRYLLEYNRADLDFSYLTQWINKLGLMKEWSEWWEQAFQVNRCRKMWPSRAPRDATTCFSISAFAQFVRSSFSSSTSAIGAREAGHANESDGHCLAGGWLRSNANS